jgi:hypothetical protein
MPALEGLFDLHFALAAILVSFAALAELLAFLWWKDSIARNKSLSRPLAALSFVSWCAAAWIAPITIPIPLSLAALMLALNWWRNPGRARMYASRASAIFLCLASFLFLSFLFPGAMDYAAAWQPALCRIHSVDYFTAVSGEAGALYADCIDGAASRQKNPSVCLLHEDWRYFSNCAGVSAQGATDPLGCKRIYDTAWEANASGPGSQDEFSFFYSSANCFAAVAQSTKNPGYCNVSYARALADRCYASLARAANDPGYCGRCRDKAMADGCYENVALATGNSTCCLRISDYSMRQWCHDSVEGK